MKTLFEAIYNYWSSKGKLGLTELYNTEAPDDAIFPYGTIALPDTVSDWTFTEKFKDCLIQFTLFSKTKLATEICAVFKMFKGAFDFHDLTIEGATTISLTRKVSNIVRVEAVWRYNVSYRIVLQM